LEKIYFFFGRLPGELVTGSGVDSIEPLRINNMDILTDLIIILSVSAVALYVSSKLKLPSIVGFLTAGVLVGPYGIELISTAEEVNIMAEIGILLLLFSIGIEFSLDKLIESRKYVLLGGSVQVGLSILLFFGGAYLLGLQANQAIFVGMLFAMSSTAIVLQLFQEKGWMNTLFGKSSTSILIFQDIIIIPMMLAAPYLTENGSMEAGSATKIGMGFLLVILVVFAARKVIPSIIRSIVHTRNQELFLISIIVICFATAFITKQLGLKLALGAFLAGLVISESEYSYEALKNIMPFKKIFTAIFFISVGMLLNLGFVFEHFFLLAGITLLVMLVKFLIIAPTTFMLNIGVRNALVSGLVLCQVGEFAFILSKVGLEAQLLSDFNYQMFLSVSILSMVISAIMIGYAPAISEKIINLPLVSNWLDKKKDKNCLPAKCGLVDHTIVIGYGPGGRRIAKFLIKREIPLAVIELNERNIKEEDYEKAAIIIGNAKDDEVLKRAALESAKQVIITVPEAAMAEAITIKIRKLNHNANIVVRTKYEEEAEELHKLGANKVVPEEISVADTIMASIA
jgi:CPA2 family monovalent cation:H+ antiporter-2